LYAKQLGAVKKWFNYKQSVNATDFSMIKPRNY